MCDFTFTCAYTQVDSQWTNKDYAGAKRSSLCAMLWSIVAMVFGGLVVAIYISLVAVYTAHESGTGMQPDNE